MTVISWKLTPEDPKVYAYTSVDIGPLDAKKTAISRFADRVIGRQR